MRKIYLLIGAIAVLIAVLASCYFVFIRSSRDVDTSLAPVRIGYNTESITNVSIIVAFEKGYFQKHGVLPHMVPLKSGREVMQALAAGQIDLGIGGFANFMQAMAKGAPIRYIAASASSPSFVFVRPNENLRSFSDLYGKNVSVTSNGINELIFQSVMSQENINTKNMKFADVERSYLTAALIGKRAVDAVVVSEQDTEMMFKAGAIILPEWESRGYAEQAEPRNSIVVNTGFLNQQEATVGNFLEALIDAHRLISAMPTEAAEALAKHIKDGSSGAIVHSPEKIVEQWKNKETVNMIWQDPKITMKLAKKAKEMGAIDKELTLQDVYDLRFSSKLEAAQKEIYGE